jgi:hypothetical protein
MHYVGIDLHKRFMVVACQNESGTVGKPVRLECRDVPTIVSFFTRLRPFVCVIEASSSYRWLYELLQPLGRVNLAHPLRLKAMVAGRAKTLETWPGSNGSLHPGGRKKYSPIAVFAPSG